ncbi:homeobox-containing protein 1-like isoform X2 [Periophthalmus magnuspinnatus]|uniref:homeobox-containing protein 1-like isoform X2 n=1 Tax=Periophthalmus magnuspinnatus TaxID=409849 RepID=UPI00145AC044|nr:homeobox-containing protein 1-like isoform X2 [Periophthalmus magnuspinnatus]
MFQQCEEPRFTIEQIDLLQRLRRTGITQAEVLHALDTLEHLDRQHGHKLPHKPPYLPPPSSLSSSNPAASSCSMSTATQTSFPNSRVPLSPSNAFDSTSPPLPVPVASPVTMAAHNGLVAVTNGKLSPPRFPLGVVNASVVPPVYGFEVNEEEMDIEDKVEDLMRRDSAVIKDEIKSFLASRRISQAVVAQVTGISQSRISHWLLQQGSDLSEQKKRAFFRWYQLEKTNPGATLAMRAAPLALDDVMDWHQAPPPFVPTPGGFRLRRGSRFTWRKECLAVMESYFSDNQYPDEAKREEIATACNAVIQRPGKKLSDLERVTSLKVYNWFANRRKDLKRRANIASILESHGIDVQSPGGQSNSDEVDGNDFPDQVCEVPLFDKRASARPFLYGRADLSSPTQVPTLLPSWFSALGRGALAGHRSSLIGRTLLSGLASHSEGGRLSGVSWSPPSPSLQDEATIHTVLAGQEPVNLEKANDEQASAAALANQSSQEDDVKPEGLEDD